MVISPWMFLMVAPISNVEIEEEHPHFALLAYLAEVASVRDPLPEEPETVEDEVTHGSIEDILTAAALAESMKEEIFISEDADVTMDEDDEDVDITTLPGGDADETRKEDQPAVTESEDEPKDSDIISAPELHLGNTTQGPHDIVETDDNASGTVLLQSQNEAHTTVDTTAPIKSEIPIEDDQDEWESLISYSEAEDNTIDHTTANDRGASSEQDTLPAGDVEETNVLPVVPSPNDTIGIDEMGQFAAPLFNFFEDPSEPDQPVVQTRLSLDNTAILPFPTEQNLVTSPPKRQISALNQLDNVTPHYLLLLIRCRTPSKNVNQIATSRIPPVSTSSANEHQDSAHEKPVIRSLAVTSPPLFNPCSTHSHPHPPNAMFSKTHRR